MKQFAVFSNNKLAVMVQSTGNFVVPSTISIDLLDNHNLVMGFH